MQPGADQVLPAHTRGDEWEGIDQIGPVTFDLLPPAAPVTSCRLYFRNAKGGLAYKLKSNPDQGEVAGAIDVLDADLWIFQVPKQALPLPVGTFKWDFEVTADGYWEPLTLVKGTITITEDQSHD